ncbi:MAG: response regulator transcription factor [Propionibacteriaceae bacterium]|nr:response regulator transcription factor [Propionibacteriaceae bacterium]
MADDDSLVQEAFVAFFSQRETFRLVAQAYNGREAVSLFEEHRPDVVLMDLQMPGMSGIEATRIITSTAPDPCVIALTTFSTHQHVVPALQAGAAGYLLKDCGADALVQGIHDALAGEMPLSPEVRMSLVRSVVPDHPEVIGPGRVSTRERELLGWLAHGLSNREIAARMFLSEGTVKQYLLAIGDKFGVRSRTQILVTAIRHGLVDLHALPEG